MLLALLGLVLLCVVSVNGQAAYQTAGTTSSGVVFSGEVNFVLALDQSVFIGSTADEFTDSGIVFDTKAAGVGYSQTAGWLVVGHDAANQVYSSLDGSSFVAVESLGPIFLAVNAAAFGGQRFVCGSQSQSTNTIAFYNSRVWTPVASPDTWTCCNSIASNRTFFVAVGMLSHFWLIPATVCLGKPRLAHHFLGKDGLLSTATFITLGLLSA
jgi:hypothetical protein